MHKRSCVARSNAEHNVETFERGTFGFSKNIYDLEIFMDKSGG